MGDDESLAVGKVQIDSLVSFDPTWMPSAALLSVPFGPLLHLSEAPQRTDGNIA